MPTRPALVAVAAVDTVGASPRFGVACRSCFGALGFLLVALDVTGLLRDVVPRPRLPLRAVSQALAPMLLPPPPSSLSSLELGSRSVLKMEMASPKLRGLEPAVERPGLLAPPPAAAPPLVPPPPARGDVAGDAAGDSAARRSAMDKGRAEDGLTRPVERVPCRGRVVGTTLIDLTLVTLPCRGPRVGVLVLARLLVPACCCFLVDDWALDRTVVRPGWDRPVLLAAGASSVASWELLMLSLRMLRSIRCAVVICAPPTTLLWSVSVRPRSFFPPSRRWDMRTSTPVTVAVVLVERVRTDAAPLSLARVRGEVVPVVGLLR